MKIVRRIRQWLAMAERVRKLEAELLDVRSRALVAENQLEALRAEARVNAQERRASRNAIEKVRQALAQHGQALAQHEKEVG